MKKRHTIFTKRIYDQPEKSDGFRILVDRLWPRGISKDEAGIDVWLKDIAPSTSLRKWFHQEAGSWEEFTERYLSELKTSKVVEALIHLIKEHEPVTLLYAVRDKDHNHAQLLKAFLQEIHHI